MSSGFGINGGRGRCFPFFQHLAKCHVERIEPKEVCQLFFEDYNECLYHRKEKLRLQIAHKETEEARLHVNADQIDNK